ncbi:MAG: hypothetical protein AB7V18_19695 [Pyrinomonadaceae bacterium]
MQIFTALVFILFMNSLASANVFSRAFTDHAADIQFQLNKECSPNPDSRYDRNEMLGRFAVVLDRLFPNYESFNKYRRDFFVQDLTDVANNYRIGKDDCITFANGHVYYFAPIGFEKAAPHIAILKKGTFKIFENIDCSSTGDRLSKVMEYLELHLEPSPEKKDILTRVANYRRYGFYVMFDRPNEYCIYNESTSLREPTGEENNTTELLEKFADILRRSIRNDKQRFRPGFFIERGRATGFFVYDLTDPTQRQTSLLESITLKKGHIYHFAAIDLPWSFSFIAVAGKNENDTKIFRALNCKGRGDKISNVLDFLSMNLPDSDNKKEIMERVKNYRSYGTYASFDGISEPQCRDYAEIAR